MSTLKTVWTCGLICALSAMRWAIMARILVSGTSAPGKGGMADVVQSDGRTSGGTADGSGGAAAGAGLVVGASATGGAADGAFLASCWLRWRRMSSFVMRPCGPVPALSLIHISEPTR